MGLRVPLAVTGVIVSVLGNAGLVTDDAKGLLVSLGTMGVFVTVSV